MFQNLETLIENPSNIHTAYSDQCCFANITYRYARRSRSIALRIARRSKYNNDQLMHIKQLMPLNDNVPIHCNCVTCLK